MDDPNATVTPSIPLADPPVATMPQEPVPSLPLSDHHESSASLDSVIKPPTPPDPTPVKSVLPVSPLLPPEPPPDVKEKSSHPTPSGGGVDKPHHKGNKGALFAVILVLFVALPLSVIFVSNQKQLSDNRSRAAEDTYGSCLYSCANGYTCNDNHVCVASGVATGTRPLTCTRDCAAGNIVYEPEPPWCEGHTLCTARRKECMTAADVPGSKYKWCYIGLVDTSCTVSNQCHGSGTADTPTPTTHHRSDTPTPTPQQCKSIKLYKDGVLVTDYSTIRPGDTVVVATAAGTADKARVRINGAAWQVTTTKNANNEYVVTLTVPSGVSSVTVEAEIYADGVWK